MLRVPKVLPAPRVLPAIRLWAAIVLWTLSSSVFAIELIGYDSSGGRSSQEQIDRQCASLHRTLSEKLNDIDRVCTLTDGQRKKLKVAAKGAVEKLRERLTPSSTANVSSYVVDIGDERALLWPVTVFSTPGGRASLSAPVDPIWQATLDRVLTEEQTAAYQQAVVSRNEYRRQSSAQAAVANLDRHLFLSANQRRQLEKTVFDYLQQHNNFEMPGITNVALVVAPVAENILSQAQLARWKQLCSGGVDERQPARPRLKVRF